IKMLHVTTEVGKPGYTEREKRHFPEQHNKKSGPAESHAMRRRRFLHHGHCTVDDTAWKPHAMAVEPAYTDCGPDWKSSLRYIPSPRDERRKNEELWPEKSSHLRTFPGSNGCSAMEWSYYTNGYPTGKKCFFGSEKQHKRSEYSCDHVDFDATMGCKRKESEIDRRNGFDSAAHGDNVYQAAEYAPDFFKHGSTVPAVNFGGNGSRKAETFIPLFPLEKPLGPDYSVKARVRRVREDELEVAALERWRPATPLGQQQQQAAPGGKEAGGAHGKRLTAS
ncbi:hypothetical protein BOX15_Mlig013838g1, partial [Macrostomum lignano]